LRSLGHPLAVGLIAVALVTAGISIDRLGRSPLGIGIVERHLLDLRFKLRGPIPVGPEVVVLALDDRSRKLDPQLHQRRAGWAEVVRAAHRAGARVIGVDVLFVSPERPLDTQLQSDIADYLGDRSELVEVVDSEASDLLRRVQDETLGDAKLERAIAEAGNVILAMYLRAAAGGQERRVGLEKARYGQDVPGETLPPQKDSVTSSLPQLNQAALALGLLSLEVDETQSARELPLALRFETRTYAALAVQTVASFTGVDRGRLAYLGVDNSVRIGDRVVPLNDKGALWLNYRGQGGSFETHSLVDLVQGRLPTEALRDRIALIGYSYFGHDTIRTPFDPHFSGVEMHATAVDNLLRGDWLRRSTPGQDAFICAMLGLLLALLFGGLPRLSPPAQLAGAGLLVLGYLGASQLLFARAQLWLPSAGPLLVAVVVTPACLAASYLREGLQRRRLRRTFAHYLSDDLIEQMLQDPSKLSLGGERRHLTVLFSDIRNFTSLAERMPPEKLVAVLNAYLAPMTRRVLDRGGYLDKYIGDALMAIFGAPVPAEDHARRALAVALDMQEELARLRAARAEGEVELAIGIGVNTGEMVVGNMGSADRFDYTAIGDAVNLASRLEGLCRHYGVGCLVGEETHALAGEGYRFRAIDRVRVKGKRTSVEVFELLGDGARSVADYRALERYRSGLERYRGGDFAAARADFSSFAAENPEDQVVARHLERLASLGDSPPPGWDGIADKTDK